MGKVYKILKDLGNRGRTTAPNTTTLTKEDFKIHFEKVSDTRFENNPEDIDRVIDQMEEIEDNEKSRFWADILDKVPCGEEIVTQMRKMKDSAPGKDGVRISYLTEAGPEIMNKLVEMIKFMFENTADKWEDSLKIGMVIPLHKKGGINIPHNFRGVTLLAMGS